MSKGEESCKWFNQDEAEANNVNCIHFVNSEECNKKCEFYNPINDKDTPPEIEKQAEEAIKHKNEKDINLKLSGLPKFDKIHEFVVLKRHVFELQSISPKKIILKYKRKLNDSDRIADGCYVFVDKEDKLLLPHKVFTKFHRDAKKKIEEREKEKTEQQEKAKKE